MADRLKLNIEVESNDGKERKASFTYDLPKGETADYQLQWFSHHLSTEALVESKQNEFLTKLPDPSCLCSGSPVTKKFKGSDIDSYSDARNVGWVWLEICNLLLSARIYLARARAYKEFEPAHSGNPGEENRILYIVHLRKMSEFHLAVKNIKKLEDMILRLVFEGAGASLEGIDISQDEWERQLTLDNVKDGLKKRDANARLKNMPDNEYNELRSIRGKMSHGGSKTLHRFWQYRHALEHRLPQSVDYVEMYAALEPRPRPIEEGDRRIGTREVIGARPNKPDWRFEDLYNTTVATYEHYLELLKRLNNLPMFKR